MRLRGIQMPALAQAKEKTGQRARVINVSSSVHVPTLSTEAVDYDTLVSGTKRDQAAKEHGSYALYAQSKMICNLFFYVPLTHNSPPFTGRHPPLPPPPPPSLPQHHLHLRQPRQLQFIRLPLRRQSDHAYHQQRSVHRPAGCFDSTICGNGAK